MDDVMAEMASEMKIEKLHANTIDRVERYLNKYHGGECDMRTLIRVIIKHLEQTEALAHDRIDAGIDSL